MKFSANLGFLWADRPLADAIRAAAAAGFDAVECHWPYDQGANEVRAALEETGLAMLGLNTRRGRPGENGLAALPGREAEARTAIDEALDYAARIDAANIHVMAGFANGAEAHETFAANLRYAARRAAEAGRTILIEPLNRHDAPGYFLRDTEQAAALIDGLGVPNLRLMFDCYHVQRTEGDVTTRLATLLPLVGHIQFAAAPDRGPPDHGELNYPFVFAEIRRLGWRRPLGAEYKPAGPTEASLGWLAEARGI
ncbi:hydroxypyruvate isomerase family protein [Acidimangrovimonas sediminis]|uniref:hydroxypyruvate isomerase family protein n=1 Tax=Acidimangrovimonas sediminis TaxID=2056283 RepID=UPI000C7FA64C|nr:TIM barrel protein [Acidimangrovimonas sediminis]